MRKSKEQIIEAGFMAIAQSDVAVVHKTDSSCWDDEQPHYIPFKTVEEGIAHGNTACTKCCGEISPSEHLKTGSEGGG